MLGAILSSALMNLWAPVMASRLLAQAQQQALADAAAEQSVLDMLEEENRSPLNGSRIV